MYFSFKLDRGLIGGMNLRRNRSGVVFCGLSMELIVDDGHDMHDLVRHKDRCARLCAWLVEHVALYGAEFEAIDGNSDCLPSVPIARSLSQIVVADHERVARSYEDTQAFWRAGWETVADFDGHRVLVREPNLIAGPDYLERVQPHHWALARAAKPGLTRYSRPRVLPEEMPVFNAGPPRLTAVGYDPGSRTVEYSCVLDEGQHVQGWEIYALRNIVETGATSGGDPVSIVRVVFLDDWAARQEKRPLLDVGCEVHCYAESGELERIDE